MIFTKEEEEQMCHSHNKTFRHIITLYYVLTSSKNQGLEEFKIVNLKTEKI